MVGLTGLVVDFGGCRGCLASLTVEDYTDLEDGVHWVLDDNGLLGCMYSGNRMSQREPRKVYQRVVSCTLPVRVGIHEAALIRRS